MLFLQEQFDAQFSGSAGGLGLTTHVPVAFPVNILIFLVFTRFVEILAGRELRRMRTFQF
jgi:hypothetical protein